ncbi:putative ribonuclease H-like domain-containing protein [Tanacetum coccineum]
MYYLVVTDDYSRFSWVFFLTKKDETSKILKDFITGIENQLNHKVKIIRCDNETEFKNYEMNQFCRIKGIKREFSNVRTPQQNGVAERKNRALIEAARTMLANLLLPIPFWAEVVNTACYVQNRVLVTKPYNKTPYELLIGRTPIISYMRPFGCLVTILNTLDHLGKFDGKADEGFLVGNKTNGNVGLETNSNARQAGKENVPDQEYILLPLLHTSSNVPSYSKEDESSPKDDAGKKNKVKDPVKEDTSLFRHAYDDEDVGVEADTNNLETTISVSPIPTTRIHKDHLKAQIIRKVHSVVQTRRMAKQHEAGSITFINKQRRTNNKDFQDCLFACFLSQMEPKKVTQALDDESWVEAINKKDQRGIVVRNKARLVAQGYRQEKGVDYDEVFALVARIEVISVKTISIPMETHKPLSKDADGTDVDIHLYRSIRHGVLRYIGVHSLERVIVMSSVTSAVTYTFVYTDSEPGRAFWGADDEEISKGGILRTPPVPQDENKHELMFVKAHEFPAEEQPLPHVDSPTAESPGYVTESDPEEDLEEYGNDETEDGLVDYPIDEGDDRDDDDGDSSRDDANDKDKDEDEEEEKEHLAPTDSAIVIPVDEPVFPPEGTELVIPPPSTDITVRARITVRPQTSISLPPEAEVERLLAMTTSSPSPPISLSPPSVGERLTRYTALPAHSSPSPLPPSLYIPPPVDCRDDIPESKQPPRKRLYLSTLSSRYEVSESSTARPTKGRGIDYGFVSMVDAKERRQGIRDVGYGIRDT